FDLVVANEARALGLATRIANGAPVLGDMHEWAPEERAHVRSWRLLVKPFMTQQCGKYLPAIDAVTTVNDSIAGMYASRFGCSPRVVRNASPLAKLSPTPVVDDRIRLVHSGGAVPGRNVEVLIDAAVRLEHRFSLDLYLVPARDGGKYLDHLKSLTAASDSITLHPPVLPSELVTTLNAYDVGVFSLPHLTPNHRFMLPNKFFDFVQARLGIVFNSAPETDALITEHDLGVIAGDATADAMVAALDGLDTEQVRRFKANADRAAAALCSEQDEKVLRDIMATLLGITG
ncbi:MAG: hypothetical protein ACRDRL_29805, partial [Sciscionella sp.]